MFRRGNFISYVLIIAAMGLSHSASAAPYGVKLGVLNCTIDAGWGYVVGSSKALRCAYHPERGNADFYVGSISKFGLDVGYTSAGVLAWEVIAPTSDVRAGALEGEYAGATASATVAAGVGANVLIGGFDKSIALQPVSLESSSGLDIAAGISALSLKAASRESGSVAATSPPLATLPPESSTVPIRTLVVTFAFGKATLTHQSRHRIRIAAIEAKHTHAGQILVTGHADRVGTNPYNERLSLRRAEAVRAELVRDGLDDSRIHVAGRGFHDAAVPTREGIRNARNRRVVIELRPPEQQHEAAR